MEERGGAPEAARASEAASDRPGAPDPHVRSHIETRPGRALRTRMGKLCYISQHKVESYNA